MKKRNLRVRKLHSIFITREYCFLRRKTFEHFRTEYFRCNCFNCLHKEQLKKIEIELNHKKYLFWVNEHNFDDVFDSEVIKKIIIFEF